MYGLNRFKHFTRGAEVGVRTHEIATQKLPPLLALHLDAVRKIGIGRSFPLSA